MTLLWHGNQPIGICLFTSPPLALKQRHRFFGMSGKWSRTSLRLLNRQLVMLSRVVIHPAYRGAGIASAFIRRSCEQCRWPWIETLAQMGQMNPFFERAGFTKVGSSEVTGNPSIAQHSSLWGTRRNRDGKRKLVSEETYNKSRFARPVYFVFDNRNNCGRIKAEQQRKDD